MLRYILITGLVLLCPFCSVCQEADLRNYPFTIGTKFHYGYILIHSKSIREIRDSYPFGIEIDFSWHQNGQKQWDNCHCYPRTGLMINYFHYDNPEILGDGFAAVYYVEPFFGAHRKLSFSVRAGTGVSYISKPYDEESNPNNQSYSTYLNAFLLVDLSLNYRINENTGMNASFGFNHTSNGGIKVPNKGINFPTVSIGIDYTIDPEDFLNRDKSNFKEEGQRRQRLDVDIFGMFKSYMHGEPVRHLIWGGSVNYSYQVGRLSALIGGAEFMVNGVVNEEILRRGIEDKSSLRAGLLFGHEFLIGRYHFSTHMGFYAYRPYRDKEYDIFYQRYKLTYCFKNRLYLGVSLKAHRHVADYFDIRLGYSFEKISFR